MERDNKFESVRMNKSSQINIGKKRCRRAGITLGDGVEVEVTIWKQKEYGAGALFYKYRRELGDSLKLYVPSEVRDKLEMYGPTDVEIKLSPVSGLDVFF